MQTPALAAFDVEVDADSCFPELLLAAATVDVACRCCTLAIGGGNGVYDRCASGLRKVRDLGLETRACAKGDKYSP